MKNNRSDRSSFSSRRGGYDRDFMTQPSYFEERDSYGAPRGGFGGGPRRGGGGRGGPQVTPTGPEIIGTVKWFNTERGFGFVGLSDGSGDVFLHANTLSTLGHTEPEPGTTVVVRVGQGPKGRQVAEVLSVDASTATPEAPRRSAPVRQERFHPAPDLSNAEEMRGIVKWYNTTKGFGFITPESGGKDVFVHASALERSGLNGLADNQTVGMKVVQGHKGPEAVELTAE